MSDGWIKVDGEDLREMLIELVHLRRQVRELQARGTELLLENCELKKRPMIFIDAAKITYEANPAPPVKGYIGDATPNNRASQLALLPGKKQARPGSKGVRGRGKKSR